MHKINRLLRSRAHILLDEMDSLSAISHSVILPVGEIKTLDTALMRHVVSEWVIKGVLFKAVFGGSSESKRIPLGKKEFITNSYSIPASQATNKD